MSGRFPEVHVYVSRVPVADLPMVGSACNRLHNLFYNRMTSCPTGYWTDLFPKIGLPEIDLLLLLIIQTITQPLQQPGAGPQGLVACAATLHVCSSSGMLHRYHVRQLRRSCGRQFLLRFLLRALVIGSLLPSGAYSSGRSLWLLLALGSAGAIFATLPQLSL